MHVFDIHYAAVLIQNDTYHWQLALDKCGVQNN